MLPVSQPSVRSIVVITCVIVAVCTIGLLVSSVVRTVRDLPVILAVEQTSIFEDMRKKAFVATDPAELVGCLTYVESNYPSGTKHSTGSPSDRIVEGYRAAVIREIVGRLRTVTGVDLGEAPRPWIEKYGKG